MIIGISHRRCSTKKDALKNFAKFTRTLLKKRFRNTCFPLNFAKFSKAPILKSICKWLLLKLWLSPWFNVVLKTIPQYYSHIWNPLSSTRIQNKNKKTRVSFNSYCLFWENKKIYNLVLKLEKTGLMF